MNYEQKLKQFNATDKYDRELQFLLGLIGTKKPSILDYGCGTGHAVDYFREIGQNVYGYDKTQYNPIFKYYDPRGEYHTVYFMHSFAHIDNIKEVLVDLNCKEIVVITPNRLWIDKQNDVYIPDPTVIHHYTELELINLFESLNFEIDITGQFGQLTNGQNERIFLKARKK